ncbi:MAG: Polysaccharide biosynthesis protein [Candidatus Roizmanbacteria bacterium GW2011_GWA2_35_8]|uniref:Polysaccharide biosynthesis protein n=1 Tax=Candidatus Roizmanbacteria bacterium GW2011_GWA2_35_8 TaxID=1618479 RepID=A0A0G0DE83_9BACT|nr:MAG: Polysaccharide biosynthesis protein [Candidatus Roizmanbacteria bacterium GW2011_GWA2_35_8]
MDKNQVSEVKRKTIISALSLFFQSGYAAFLGLAANLVLTILLTPGIFGIYIATLSIISILNYFSDIGLAASLIQKKEVTRDDEKTAFTIQQFLVVSLVISGFFATSAIRNFYKLPVEGTFLYWSLLLGFFLSSLKTIPSVFLERKIHFQKIVLVQIIENTFFYLTVIILALMGYGLNSFTYAVILRSLVGLTSIYIISPWKPAIGINAVSFRRLVSFGAPFQASSLLALVKDDLMILYLGKVLGFTGLGYIGWAKKWAEAPIRIIMDNISRILFPLFSKFQNEKERLVKLVEKIIFYQSFLILPAIIGAALTMRQFINLIPRYTQWTQALPLFYLFCLSALLSSYSTPFINLLNGLGYVKISFYFMVGWTAATWILTPILIKIFGYLGFPITLVILSMSFVIVIYQTKKVVNFSFLKNIYPFLISSLIMAVIVSALLRVSPFSALAALIIAVLVGIMSYLFMIRFVFKIDFLKEFKILRKNE